MRIKKQRKRKREKNRAGNNDVDGRQMSDSGRSGIQLYRQYLDDLFHPTVADRLPGLIVRFSFLFSSFFFFSFSSISLKSLSWDALFYEKLVGAIVY